MKTEVDIKTGIAMSDEEIAYVKYAVQKKPSKLPVGPSRT
jgi:hypothetical protein